MIYMIETIDYGGAIRILKEDREVILKDTKPTTFLNQWCVQFGSSYEGRKLAFAKSMQIKQKIPILISERTKDILFPICSIRSSNCIWLNYKTIIRYKKVERKTCIIFENKTSVLLDVDIRTIRREMHLCFSYLNLLDTAVKLNS